MEFLGCKYVMDVLGELDYNHFENEQTLKDQFSIVLSFGTVQQMEHFI